MTEADWLAGTDPDGMLEHVAPRFTPRRWRLLLCAYLRRRWELLPADGPFRPLVEAVEADPDRGTADGSGWMQQVRDGTGPLTAAARADMGQVVRPADPAAADITEPVTPRANMVAPAFPLFQGASRYAARAVEEAGAFLLPLADAVGGLFADHSPDTLLYHLHQIEAAAGGKAEAGRLAATALKLKHLGDETADRAAGLKNKRLEEAKAVELVRKEDERGRELDDERAERAVRKTLPRLLHELAGNPFGDYRFDPRWHTEAVLGLARTIDADRAFDRMPILADALLDADCDSEPILRHLRGTETFTKEKAAHARGCWVLDRILRPDDPLFAGAEKPKPLKRPRRKGAE